MNLNTYEEKQRDSSVKIKNYTVTRASSNKSPAFWQAVGMALLLPNVMLWVYNIKAAIEIFRYM
jgi:hypothetical protein